LITQRFEENMITVTMMQAICRGSRGKSLHQPSECQK